MKSNKVTETYYIVHLQAPQKQYKQIENKCKRLPSTPLGPCAELSYIHLLYPLILMMVLGGVQPIPAFNGQEAELQNE